MSEALPGCTHIPHVGSHSWLPFTQGWFGVGATVGAVVGAADGVAVGAAVGNTEGVLVGNADGAAVGAAEGAAVGEAVGAAVGATDGAAVGAQETHLPSLAPAAFSQGQPPAQSVALKHRIPKAQPGQAPPPQSTSVSEPSFPPLEQLSVVGTAVGVAEGAAVGDADGAAVGDGVATHALSLALPGFAISYPALHTQW